MTVKLFVALHGGCNFSHDTRATEFASLAAAEREYDRRLHHSFWPNWGDPGVADFTNDGRVHAGRAWYVDLEQHHEPAVPDEYGRLTIDTTDMYPDRDLTRGPRGGLRWERC